MPIVTYTILWLISSIGLFLFGFMLGRCARKLPVLDDTLPWTMHWLYVLPDNGPPTAACDRIPKNPHRPGD